MKFFYVLMLTMSVGLANGQEKKDPGSKHSKETFLQTRVELDREIALLKKEVDQFKEKLFLYRGKVADSQGALKSDIKTLQTQSNFTLKVGESLIAISGLVIAVFAVGVGYELFSMQKGVKNALKELNDKKEMLLTETDKVLNTCGDAHQELVSIQTALKVESDKYSRVMRVSHCIVTGEFNSSQFFADVSALCEMGTCETIFSVVGQLIDEDGIKNDHETYAILNEYWTKRSEPDSTI